MNKLTFLFAGYGLLLIVGGLIGLAKAGSTASFVSGSASGFMFFLFAHLSRSAKTFRAAVLSAAALSTVLALVFAVRFSKATNSGVVPLVNTVLALTHLAGTVVFGLVAPPPRTSRSE
eukprot:TRINITY_DN8010_c0_g1_i1.p1 TRINITY_DN8010_c0_g1~~TRINITY_DN8010_c0_g1_i1.p1  ORF type:complete len:135 (+),score=5.29 TRINITY_DN8010_c0_g1_i1:53-406(+)